jgi:hypothetical protein
VELHRDAQRALYDVAHGLDVRIREAPEFDEGFRHVRIVPDGRAVQPPGGAGYAEALRPSLRGRIERVVRGAKTEN